MTDVPSGTSRAVFQLIGSLALPTEWLRALRWAAPQEEFNGADLQSPVRTKAGRDELREQRTLTKNDIRRGTP